MDKIKAFLSSLKGEIVDTWERSKMFILAILALIIALKFRSIYEQIQVYLGEMQLKSTQKQDATVKAKEDVLSQQGDDLVKQAEALPSEQPPVDADWYKKETK